MKEFEFMKVSPNTFQVHPGSDPRHLGSVSLRPAGAETVRSGKAYDCNVTGGRIPHVRLRVHASPPSLTSSSSGANYHTWTTHPSSTPSLWTLSSAWHTSA
jgi:hypothetical protein